jgi:hypothetical protein
MTEENGLTNRWREMKTRFNVVISKFNAVIRAIRDPIDRDTAQSTITRLTYLLKNPCSKDPELYATTLQVALISMGIPVPPNIFIFDLNEKRRWTRRPELGSSAIAAYRPGELGWRKLARRFIDKGHFVEDQDAFRRHLRRSAERELEWLEDAYDLFLLTAFFCSKSDFERVGVAFDALVARNSSDTPFAILRKAVALARDRRTNISHMSGQYNHRRHSSFGNSPRPIHQGGATLRRAATATRT